MNGIRYFDIRLESNDEKEIYLTHGGLDCMNRNTGKKYYLSDVFNEAIDFFTSLPQRNCYYAFKG
jgi:hypothetical protein